MIDHSSSVRNMASQQQGVGRESRHLWVGGLPDSITEAGIKDYFSKYGKIEGVKILPQKYPNIGVAAFIDFCDVQSAIEARDAKHKLGGNELRTNFKAKATEKFDACKKKVSSSPDKTTKDRQQAQGSSSSSSSESETDDSSSSSSASSDQGTNGKKLTKKHEKESEISTLFLRVTGLANRPERVLQDGLYYEFCRYSPHAVVRIYGDVPEKRSAVVKYNSIESCREAFTRSQGMVLFGSKLKLVPLEIKEFPPGGRDQPFVSHIRHSPLGDVDPQATRSLFVGNIPKNISIYELRDIFQRFGNVLDVEIKKMGGNATYGFVLYYDLLHAVNAKQCMDGQNIKGNNIRVGFGKGTPSKTLWIDGIDPHTTEAQLEKQIVKYGKVVRLGVDRSRCCAMVQYDNADSAKDALNSLKGSFIGNSKRLMTDFANRDARAAFFSRVDEGEGSALVRPFPGPPGIFGPGMIGRRGGVMMPRGGIPMMGVDRGGYPFAGPPLDYFFNPYLDEGMEFFGGGRPPFHHGLGPIGLRRFGPQPPGGYSQGMDDYEEELRAFSRKREWEREREKHKKRESTSPSGAEEEKLETVSAFQRKKRPKEKHKKLGKKAKVKESSPIDSDDDTENDSGEKRELARQKATQRAKERREKNRKKMLSVDKKSDNDDKISSEDESKAQRKMQVKETQLSPEWEQDNVRGKSVDVKEEYSDDEAYSNSKEDPKPLSDATFGKGELLGDSSPLPKDPLEVFLDIQPSTTESPQSPVVVKKYYERVKVESDLSSDEEFRDNIGSSKETIDQLNQPSDEKECCGTSGPRTPEAEQDNPPTPVHKQSMSEEDSDGKTSKQEYSKKLRLLPRRYQIEEDIGVEKREFSRVREYKDSSRIEKRHYPDPKSPSPHGHHRRHHHSPLPEYMEKRWHHRGRPSSPGAYTQRRVSSRSPQRYSGSPSHRHHSSSPPPPRSRSPISHSRGRDRCPQRHRYDSPPFDGGRGKYGWRGTSPPHHRYQYSPSPPHRPRSPIGRRYGWHKSPSFSPPRRSPAHVIRRDKSPGSGGSRFSPRFLVDDHHDTSKRYGKRPMYSRTPSPKPKHHEPGKEDIPETKRRKMLEEHRLSSPAASSLPPPPSREVGKPVKSGQQQSKQGPENKTLTPRLTSKEATSDQSGPAAQSGHSRSTQQTQPDTSPPVNNLLDLLRKYPVMWQGHLTLKNDLAAVQLHFLSGNAELAKMSLPLGSDQATPTLRIAQRMRLEKSQLDGVERRIQNETEHCLLLALPCGKDANDVHAQTQNLKNSLISYLVQKQAAGIINVQGPPGSCGYVLHIFPPCPFSESHLSRVAPDLSSASDNCHLMIVAATV